MSSSFSDLNVFGDEMVSFTDDRGFDVNITPGGPGADIQLTGVNIAEGDTLSFQWRSYFTLNEIISPTSTSNVTIKIDLTNAPIVAPQFSWGTLPAGVTTSTPSTNIYQVTGIQTTAAFNQIFDNASVEMVDQEATFSIKVTVSYNKGAGDLIFDVTQEYGVTTTYPEISVPATAWTGNAVEGLPVLITNEATVLDSETAAPATYTCKVSCLTSRVSAITSTGGGSASTGTVGSDTVRTITGTKAQVNAHLDTLYLTLTPAFGTLNVNYHLTNVLSGVISTGVSTGAVIEMDVFDNTPTNVRYTENTVLHDSFSTFAISSDVDSHYGDGNYKLRLFVGGDNLTAQLNGNATLSAGETITQANSGATGIQTVATTTATTMTLTNVTGTWTTNSNDTITGSVSGSHSVYPATITDDGVSGDETNTSNRDDIGWLRDSANNGTDKRGYHMIEKTDTTANLNSWLQGNITYIPKPENVIEYTFNMSASIPSLAAGTVISQAFSGSGNPTGVVKNTVTNGTVVTLTNVTGPDFVINDSNNTWSWSGDGGLAPYPTTQATTAGMANLHVKLYRTNGNLIKSELLIPMIGAGSRTVTGSTRTFAVSDNTNSATEIEDDERFFLKTDILVIGAGGHGGQGDGTGNVQGGGGGGAGEYTYQTRSKFFNSLPQLYWKAKVGDADTVPGGDSSQTSSVLSHRSSTSGTDTNVLVANNGGKGGNGVDDSGSGVPGTAGGCGGGGGAADQQVVGYSHGAGGGIVNGANSISVYTGGATVEESFVGLAASDGPGSTSFTSKGGHGGGADHSTASYGILNDISGTGVRYAYPGRGGNNTTSAPPVGPAFRTPGTGGQGGDDDADTNMTVGYDGTVIIKTYNF